MDNQKIMEIILAEEVALYEQAVELKDTFGANDDATKRAYTKWITITNLIDRINEETN